MQSLDIVDLKSFLALSAPKIVFFVFFLTFHLFNYALHLQPMHVMCFEGVVGRHCTWFQLVSLFAFIFSLFVFRTRN